MKKGKNYKESLKLIDKTKVYSAREAIETAIKTSKAKFDETVEVHVRLGVDGRQSDQQVRGVLVLPHGTGKSVKVLVVAKSEYEKEALDAGADYFDGEEAINKIKNGWLDFDVIITTPDMMAKIGQVARVLGPKGLMPNPKSGTVTTDIAKAIKDIKSGKIEYRLDKGNNLHIIIGKVSFGEDKLEENLNEFLETLLKARPASAKGTFLKNLSISTTMGPGIKFVYKQK